MLPKLRYEIYIPTSYNDQTPIEARKYSLVKSKIQEKFGGFSVHPATISGLWTNPETKQIFYDNCLIYEVVVDKLPENIKFFKEFKKELKLLFKQEEIFISCTEITWV